MNKNQELMTDGSGQVYFEVTVHTHHIRLTLIPATRAGFEEASVRIQIRDEEGHVRQGPEVPLSVIAEFTKGILMLLVEG